MNWKGYVRRRSWRKFWFYSEVFRRVSEEPLKSSFRIVSVARPTFEQDCLHVEPMLTRARHWSRLEAGQFSPRPCIMFLTSDPIPLGIPFPIWYLTGRDNYVVRRFRFPICPFDEIAGILSLWSPTFKVKPKLCCDRRSVGLSVLASSTHLGPKQLRVCWCGAPSLTRGRICRLQLLLALASAVILGSESRWTHDHILLSQVRDSPNLEGQVTVFISPRNWVPFSSPSTTLRAPVEVFKPASTRTLWIRLNSKLYNNPFRTSQETQCIFMTRAKGLIPFREIIAFYCEESYGTHKCTLWANCGTDTNSNRSSQVCVCVCVCVYGLPDKRPELWIPLLFENQGLICSLRRIQLEMAALLLWRRVLLLPMALLAGRGLRLAVGIGPACRPSHWLPRCRGGWKKSILCRIVGAWD
jgi:hypothetical protein